MRERCQSCNEPIEPGATFCTACGNTVMLPARANAVTPARRDTATAETIVQRPPSNAAPSGRRRRVAMLVVKRGSDEGKSVQVHDQAAIGADRNANLLALSDRNVSARHGVVRLEQGVHVYHDLASTNGSWLVDRNGDRKRITAPLHLMHGDTIEVGQTRIVYMEEGR